MGPAAPKRGARNGACRAEARSAKAGLASRVEVLSDGRRQLGDPSAEAAEGRPVPLPPGSLAADEPRVRANRVGEALGAALLSLPELAAERVAKLGDQSRHPFA